MSTQNAATQPTTPSKLKLFLDIPTFKARVGIDAIEIVRNPNTNKLFANTTAGKFKVERDIDFDFPIKFGYETEELFNTGCIINVSSDNLIRTL